MPILTVPLLKQIYSLLDTNPIVYEPGYEPAGAQVKSPQPTAQVRMPVPDDEDEQLRLALALSLMYELVIVLLNCSGM